MNKLGYKQLLLPLAAGAALLCTATIVLAADGEITPTLSVGNPSGGKEQTGNSSSGDDSKSFLREWTFENSFDKAGDATSSLEKALPGKINYNCSQYLSQFEMNGTKYNPSQQLAQECQRRQQEANTFKSDAAGIRKEQRIFAEVSRVSDVAAVAAIGAAAYAEVGQKTAGQSNTYVSAANLQEKAAIAAYTTGTADLGMAAWAYAQQKRKLEKMQETLNGKSGNVSGSSGNASLNSKLAHAIEQTKQAAINHAMYGAGKVAAGYAGMKLAERTRKQAAAMESFDATKAYLASLPAGTAAAPVASTSGGGTSGTFTTNHPSFALATAEEAKSVSTVAATSGGGNSSGSSSLFGSGADIKSGNKVTPSTSTADTSALIGTGGPQAMAKEAEDAQEAATQEAVAKTAFGFGEFSRGGGGSSFGGAGGKDAGGAEEIPAAPGIAPGATAPGRSVASAINPNQMIEEANAGIEGNEQGSMVGVNGNRERSLFDTIKLKHTKALQVGNVQGPASIEVKN